MLPLCLHVAFVLVFLSVQSCLVIHVVFAASCRLGSFVSSLQRGLCSFMCSTLATFMFLTGLALHVAFHVSLCCSCTFWFHSKTLMYLLVPSVLAFHQLLTTLRIRADLEATTEISFFLTYKSIVFSNSFIYFIILTLSRFNYYS